jgi:hypothetical protein
VTPVINDATLISDEAIKANKSRRTNRFCCRVVARPDLDLMGFHSREARSIAEPAHISHRAKRGWLHVMVRPHAFADEKGGSV